MEASLPLVLRPPIEDEPVKKLLMKNTEQTSQEQSRATALRYAPFIDKRSHTRLNHHSSEFALLNWADHETGLTIRLRFGFYDASAAEFCSSVAFQEIFR